MVAAMTMLSPQPWPAGTAVLIPVFNHVGTVGQVVRGMREQGAGLILVIDDGSSDGSGEAARAAGADVVERLALNQGKGAALRHGLDLLCQRGYRQVLTIDADMQHPPSEGARLAHAASAAPERLWLGVRAMADAPFISRFGRWWTSLWTWVCCGCWPVDNQTGLRVYPLPGMTNLEVHAGRYAYEVESLIRAVWGGIVVDRLAVAVRYPPDRISHFCKLKDNLRTAWAFTRLVIRRLLPWPHRQADGRRPWSAALRDGLTPGASACAAGLGAAIGVAPLPGLQLLLAAWLAMVLRLNPAVTLLASNISFGPLLAGWFALEVMVGDLIRRGTWTGFGSRLQALRDAIAEQGPGQALRPLLTDWLVGAVPVMLGVAIVAAGAGFLVTSFLRPRRA